MSCPMLLHRSDLRPSPRSTSHLGNFSYPLPWVPPPKQARRHTTTGPPDPPCLICGVFARPTLRPPPKMVLPLDASIACMTCREKKYVVKNVEEEKNTACPGLERASCRNDNDSTTRMSDSEKIYTLADRPSNKAGRTDAPPSEPGSTIPQTTWPTPNAAHPPVLRNSK